MELREKIVFSIIICVIIVQNFVFLCWVGLVLFFFFSCLLSFMVVLKSRKKLLNSIIRLWVLKFNVCMLKSGLVKVISYEIDVSSSRCMIIVSIRLVMCVWLCCFGGSFLVRMVIKIRLLMLRISLIMINVISLVQIDGLVIYFIVRVIFFVI